MGPTEALVGLVRNVVGPPTTCSAAGASDCGPTPTAPSARTYVAPRTGPSVSCVGPTSLRKCHPGFDSVPVHRRSLTVATSHRVTWPHATALRPPAPPSVNVRVFQNFSLTMDYSFTNSTETTCSVRSMIRVTVYTIENLLSIRLICPYYDLRDTQTTCYFGRLSNRRRPALCCICR